MMYDLIIIGGGPAGYLAAERAGHAGMNVLLIEKKSVGGVCLNEGCIPTKTLLYSAKLLDGAVNGGKYGVNASELNLDHAKVVARKDKVVRLLTGGVKSTLKAQKVTLIEGEGKLSGKCEDGFCVEVAGQAHQGKKLLLAMGSVPALPPIQGLQEALASGFALTSREALEVKELPASLCVIGGGVIGLELASYFCSAGTKVTVVEMLDHIAGENDKELSALLQKNYEKKGISFALSARVTEITHNGVRYEKDGAEIFLETDAALVCIGRKPNTLNMGLESIGVTLERGAVVTDVHMLTNVQNVYAAGDVNGKSMLAHTAYREAEVAINHMLGHSDLMRYTAIPSVIYTNPELASVGETEASAREKGYDVEVVTLPMRYSGRYLAENEGGDGICKVIADKKYGVILGVQALSNYASEFIVAAGIFIELQTPIERIKEIVFPHPTVAEILREAVFKLS
ncbi:MAG TPA: dihydrolipoyl dehydrogenase [Clostridia bacterium]|nr:dihydrolipoyl dehydrogenase [Clostridia bacterium]